MVNIHQVRDLWLKAEEKLELNKDRLLSDENFKLTLRAYELAIKETSEAMKGFGVWDECAECGKSPKGSCCAPEVACWYDIETFMINILMGCNLPSSSFYPDHCLFLGEKGCVLKARHYYCVHFLCPAVQNKLGQKSKEILMKIIGKELFLGSKAISLIVSKLDR